MASNNGQRSPESLLQDPSCKARVLAISDNHVAILVTRGDDDEERSLFQLTLQPFHRKILPHSYECAGNSQDNSRAILQFLSNYDFHLTSESGAEYSYYDATPKSASTWGALVQSIGRFVSFASTASRSTTTTSNRFVMGPLQSVLISPASDRQIQRASPSPAVSLIQETPVLYETVTKPYIQSIKESGSLSWIENILSGQKERERLLLDTHDYILNIDTKWRSHPDPKTTPRETWYKHESVADLYCLAIFRDGTISSLRDFRGEHLPILESMVENCTPVIERIYGVPSDQLRIFVHYQPQFYHAHVHFTRLQNDIGAQVERGHLLCDIVQNLRMDSDYYAKRTITYKLQITDPLYKLIQDCEQKK